MAPCQAEDGFGLTNDIQSDRLSFTRKLLPHAFPFSGRKKRRVCSSLSTSFHSARLWVAGDIPSFIAIVALNSKHTSGSPGLQNPPTPTRLLSLKCTTIHSIRRIREQASLSLRFHLLPWPKLNVNHNDCGHIYPTSKGHPL